MWKWKNEIIIYRDYWLQSNWLFFQIFWLHTLVIFYKKFFYLFFKRQRNNLYCTDYSWQEIMWNSTLCRYIHCTWRYNFWGMPKLKHTFSQFFIINWQMSFWFNYFCRCSLLLTFEVLFNIVSNTSDAYVQSWTQHSRHFWKNQMCTALPTFSQRLPLHQCYNIYNRILFFYNNFPVSLRVINVLRHKWEEQGTPNFFIKWFESWVQYLRKCTTCYGDNIEWFICIKKEFRNRQVKL